MNSGCSNHDATCHKTSTTISDATPPYWYTRASEGCAREERGRVWGPFRGPPLENADDAVELRFRIDQIHALGGDPQPLGGAAQAVLDDRAP